MNGAINLQTMSSALPKPPLTVEEYLAFEEAAFAKSEFRDGEMFAMSGGSYEHSAISTNITTKLQNRLGGGPCRPLNAEMRVHVPGTQLYVYPDATVLCGPPQFATKSRTTIINPTLIVEVLSPPTERYDRTSKFWDYQKLATLKSYILVTQDVPQVECFARQPGNLSSDQWLYTAYHGMESVLPLPELNIELPLREIYEGVDFALLRQIAAEDPEPSNPADS